MRAAVLTEPGGTPQVQDFEEPTAAEGAVLIDVDTAGIGAWDILAGQTLQLPTEFPMVVRGEGVGRAPDGRRVYFGEHPVGRNGAWAQKTLVTAEEVWDVPDDVDDETAITMAIAATGALVPLEQAEIRSGENVLILGATGALGQVAMYLARHLGAGRVVAAGRNAEALERLAARGVADATAQVGTDDDEASLKAAAGDGFDVVLDVVYGDPFTAALKATRFGGRLMTIGVQAGMAATVPAPDLFNKIHTVVGTGQRKPEDREAIWRRLLTIAKETGMEIDYKRFTLDQAAEAWTAQASSPHAKVVATIS